MAVGDYWLRSDYHGGDFVYPKTGGGGRMKTFIPLLAVLFIGLKLCGVIAWSWVWVLAPLWLPVAALAVACTGAIAIAFMVTDD